MDNIVLFEFFQKSSEDAHDCLVLGLCPLSNYCKRNTRIVLGNSFLYQNRLFRNLATF
jgi:hypothetical protein